MPSSGTPRDFESGTRAAAEPASLTKRLQTRHLAATCVCDGRRTSYESVTRVQISCWGSHEGQTSIRGDCRDRLRRRRILMIVASSRSISAQAESWTPPHRMLLTPERALAMIVASDRHLEYVPGEVLVRFRPGVGVAGQQRALTALRSRPAPADL